MDSDSFSDTPRICPDMIAQIALHFTNIEDIKKFMSLNRSTYEVMSMERDIMRKMKYHILLPNIKEDLIQFIQRKGKSIRNLSIELEQAFLKFLIFIFRTANNLEEFCFKCEQLHEMVKLKGDVFKSDDIFAATKINADPKDIPDMFYLRKLSLDFSSFENTKNNFLKLLSHVWNKAKYLEEFSFKCENLNMNQNLMEFREISNEVESEDMSSSTSLNLNLYNLNEMIKLMKLTFIISSPNPHTEDEYLKFLRSILIKVHNLEELHLKCSQLKSDLINLENCNDITSLKTMCLDFSSIDSATHIQNCMYRQRNLKNLSLRVGSSMNPIVFSEDGIQFQLDKMKLIVVDENNSLLPILTQPNLRELELGNVTSGETYVHIFLHCPRLEKLIVDGEGNSIISSPYFPQISSESLLYFEDKQTQNPTNATTLFRRFPYIKSLKCSTLNHAQISFCPLNEFSLEYLWCYDLRNFNAPDLQQIVIKKYSRHDIYLSEFLQCIKNVEIVIIESLSNKNDVRDVVGEVVKLNRLKKFKLRHMVGIDHEYNINQDECIGQNVIFYKILVDIEKKTVKVSSYIYRKCEEIMELLKNKYNNFDFIEFCF